MAHVIVASDDQLTYAPNDCGCSEYRRPPDQLGQFLINDCGLWPTLKPPPDGTDLRRLRAHPLLRTLALDQHYAVAFVPSYSRVAVIDAWAAALLKRLPTDGSTPTIEECETVAQLAAAGLLSEQADSQVPPPAPPTTLVAWLHLTTACNLRCGYCYSAPRNEVMSAATACQAVDAVVRTAVRHGYRSILLKYAGGEPLLQLPLLLATQHYAQTTAAAQNLQVAGAVLSNGVLLDQRAATQLAQAGLSVMVSLDGMAGVHDALRPTVNGNPSYQAAMRGLKQARAAGVPVTVGITVTAGNVNHLPEFVTTLLAEDLPFGISFYRDHAPARLADGLRPDEQQLIEGMRRVYAAVAARPPRWSVLSALLDRAHPGVAHQRSCASGEHYLVIDPHGRIARCQMTIMETLTSVDAQDPLDDLRRDPSGAHSLPVDAKAGCRLCEWRYWCGGGCAVTIHRATGCTEARSPSCAIYQALFPDILRMEGQRLLHWHQHTA